LGHIVVVLAFVHSQWEVVLRSTYFVVGLMLASGVAMAAPKAPPRGKPAARKAATWNLAKIASLASQYGTITL